MEEIPQPGKDDIPIDGYLSGNVGGTVSWPDSGRLRTHLVLGTIVALTFVFVVVAGLYAITGNRPSDVISDLGDSPSGFIRLNPVNSVDIVRNEPPPEPSSWLSRYRETVSKAKKIIHRGWSHNSSDLSISSRLSDEVAGNGSVITDLVKTKLNIKRKMEGKLDDTEQKKADMEVKEVMPVQEAKQVAPVQEAKQVAPVQEAKQVMPVQSAADVNSTPSFARLASMNVAPVPLIMGPVPQLSRHEPGGRLPIVAGDKSPGKVYARPFENNEHKPAIAIVIIGLGLASDATMAAIDKMPSDVSLSFSPYGNYPKGKLDLLIQKARLAGHEVLLDLPMEPQNISANDPGPMAILSDVTSGEATRQMELVMSQGVSYTGLAATLNSPVTRTGNMATILHNIQERGLFFLSDAASDQYGSAEHAMGYVSMVLDDNPANDAINANLVRLVSLAKKDGRAIAYLSAQPVSFSCLQSFLQKLPEQGVVLAPVSAVIGSKNE